jgi:hypothetical protein
MLLFNILGSLEVFEDEYISEEEEEEEEEGFFELVSSLSIRNSYKADLNGSQFRKSAALIDTESLHFKKEE